MRDELMKPIRLVLFDVDGVLTDGEAQRLDLDLFAHLAAMNRAAQADSSRPAVTLCTGRPAPYVEVLLQALEGHLPAVYENGCGLYVPREYRFLAHPALDGNATMHIVRKQLRDALVKTGKVFFQPGKEYSLSLFPLNGVTVADLDPLAREVLGSLQDLVDLTYSTSCLNVIPRGVDKGAGLRFLCEHSGYVLDEVLGVGDSDVDLPFLKLIGYSAAPANAFDSVKEIVEYIAPHRTSQGVRDILQNFGLPI